MIVLPPRSDQKNTAFQWARPSKVSDTGGELTHPERHTKGGKPRDEQKAERKQLIANIRDMDSAILVRKKWVTEFLARKATPKGANVFVAASIAARRNRASGLTLLTAAIMLWNSVYLERAITKRSS